MRWIVAVLVLAVVAEAVLTPPKHDAVAAVQGLISRRLGASYLPQFEFGVLAASSTGLDVAHVSSKDGKVFLEGSSATAMAYGLQAYLRQVVHTSTDWEDHALHLPPSLPLPPAPILLQKQSPYTYYQNVCTASYSHWAWSWERWEKHLDWMALQGINMPLAFTGQEKVWQATFAKFNVTSLDDFFAGAAFLAWGRMGNIQGSWVRGPLPQSFIDAQFALQGKILARMQSFGMMPALPAFAGHIPTSLVPLYPHAKVVQSDAWAGFRAPYTQVHLLDPTDPLFVRIGAAFLQTYQDLYGFTAHVYQTDTYNEMDPREASPAYLGAASSAVLRSMQMVDKDAVWLMQGWLFSFSRFWTLSRMESYLSRLPYESLIVLDLYAEVSPQWEKSQEFFHHQWIYCVLHNFGGSLGMRGDLDTIATGPVVAREKSHSLVGVGLTMEGIFQNYIVYDLALSMAWANSQVNVTEYVQSFAVGRYISQSSTTHHYLERAWNVLETSVYAVRHAYGGVTKDIVCLRPRWHLIQANFMPTELSHDFERVLEAWKLLLQAAASSPSLQYDDRFTHDLVDVTRKAMSDGLVQIYQHIQNMFEQRQVPLSELTANTADLLDRMTDLDLLLNTNQDFMLGPWLRDARSLAGEDGDDVAAAYFEYEARNQITRWGDNNRNALSDYAGKEWGGLVGSYYIPRWRLWVAELLRAYAGQVEMDMEGLHGQIEEFEVTWQLLRDAFPTTAQGSAVTVSRHLYEKYTHSDAPAVKTSRPELSPVLCLLECLW